MFTGDAQRGVGLSLITDAVLLRIEHEAMMNAVSKKIAKALGVPTILTTVVEERGGYLLTSSPP